MKLSFNCIKFKIGLLGSVLTVAVAVSAAASAQALELPSHAITVDENKSQVTPIGVPMQSLADGMRLRTVSQSERRMTDEHGLPVQPAAEDVPIRTAWINGSMGICACTLDVLAKESLKKPIGQTSLRDVNGRKFAVSVVSFSYALDIFHKLQRALEIPRGALNDGCFARAHEMSYALEKIGVLTGKVMATGHFQILSDVLKNGKVNWGFHVAPILVVDDGTSKSVWVLDPALFAEPVPLEGWLQLLAQHPRASFTNVFLTNRFVLHPDQRNQSHASWRKQDLSLSRKIIKSARIKFATSTRAQSPSRPQGGRSSQSSTN